MINKRKKSAICHSDCIRDQTKNRKPANWRIYTVLILSISRNSDSLGSLLPSMKNNGGEYYYADIYRR